ncbi:hypothetical protein RMSM_03807 [Rhodopirellula maiorica SM1]|uniref:Uncharacterized protein n=1 Tax=Rhodopirellula maiorica SM1 TaxID=1265738 RepID=M5RJ99_9BACT|nr:hypothetical protein RMSM_03807 [Rhodopirellula maiorica SM1]
MPITMTHRFREPRWFRSLRGSELRDEADDEVDAVVDKGALMKDVAEKVKNRKDTNDCQTVYAFRSERISSQFFANRD